MKHKFPAVALFALLVVQTLLLGWSSYRHGPGFDEPAHLASGVTHWRLGRYEPYRVNPPLVRMVATVPLVMSGVNVVDRHYDASPGSRPEFELGTKLVAREGPRFLWQLTISRWACIPFAWLGTIICFCWARWLFGTLSALVASTLWCFSPNVLAHAQMVTPDAGGAALGLTACYAYSKWLERPNWSGAILSGGLLNLAILAKSTWILLFAVWPALFVWRLCFPAYQAQHYRRQLVRQAALIPFTAILLLNTAYHFTGSFRRLGDYQFVSQSLSGIPRNRQSSRKDVPPNTGNRFRGSVWEKLPVPLPTDFLQGIDEQKWDFEKTMPSYFRGEKSSNGKWYFYLYAALVKLPVGTWLLVLLAAAGAVCQIARGYPVRGFASLALPPAALFVLVSSQTGINQHARYAIGILPFLFIGAAGVFTPRDNHLWNWRIWLASTALVLSVGESLMVYPHGLSFFNWAAGGPENGYRHLGIPSTDSNLDWGLDVTYLKKWSRQHGHARPLFVDVDTVLPLSALGIEAPRVELPPKPGWYAISIGKLARQRGYDVFAEMEPVGRCGYTIYLYHVEDTTKSD